MKSMFDQITTRLACKRPVRTSVDADGLPAVRLDLLDDIVNPRLRRGDIGDGDVVPIARKTTRDGTTNTLPRASHECDAPECSLDG